MVAKAEGSTSTFTFNFGADAWASFDGGGGGGGFATGMNTCTAGFGSDLSMDTGFGNGSDLFTAPVSDFASPEEHFSSEPFGNYGINDTPSFESVMGGSASMALDGSGYIAPPVDLAPVTTTASIPAANGTPMVGGPAMPPNVLEAYYAGGLFSGAYTNGSLLDNVQKGLENLWTGFKNRSSFTAEGAAAYGPGIAASGTKQVGEAADSLNGSFVVGEGLMASATYNLKVWSTDRGMNDGPIFQADPSSYLHIKLGAGLALGVDVTVDPHGAMDVGLSIGTGLGEEVIYKPPITVGGNINLPK